MKIIIHVITLVFLCLIIFGYSIGQSKLTVVDGAKVNIQAETEFINKNLNIEAGSQVSIRGFMTVNGTLVNNAGNSGLILKADQDGYGSLMHSTSEVPATVEQYLTSERWHLVSSPVSNETIETYLDIYLKKWHESDGTWEYLSQPLSTELISTKGYSVWASDALTGTTTVIFEGNLVAGDIAPQEVNYTLGSPQIGWNLIGNPYPSSVNWDETWTSSDIGGWAVVYDNGTYSGWNPFLTGDDRSYNGKTDGLIAPNQGFWVRATGEDPGLVFKQDARSHGEVPFLKDEVDIKSYMGLHLTATAKGYTDEMAVLFMEDGTLGFDGLYELEKHFNVVEAPTIYSLPDSEVPTAINVLPVNWIEQTVQPVIPVGFELEEGASCTISSTGLETFDHDLTIYLEDLEENVLYDLSYGDYSFISVNPSSPTRFLLHFGYPDFIDENSLPDFNIYSYNEYVYVKIPSSTKGSAVVYDMMGKEVLSFRLEKQLTKQVVFKTGHYIVNVTTKDKCLTKKVFIKN